MSPAHATTCHLITSGMKMLLIEPEAGMQARLRSGQEVSSVHRTQRVVHTYNSTSFLNVHTFLFFFPVCLNTAQYIFLDIPC
jgi:hypothetical protein